MAKSDNLNGSLSSLGDVESGWSSEVWQAKNPFGDVEKTVLEQRDVERDCSATDTQVDKADSAIVGLVESNSTSVQRPESSVCCCGVDASTCEC